MDAANSSARSKVIVQCTDPDGLLDKISSFLEARLPLGNLHWKSPSRPLRSIEDLNVSFVSEDPQPIDLSTSTRRHQIPGLRQTPFVKLLLVRCDDKETYKEKVRKDVKQWVKNLGSQSLGKSSNKGQERHDACEYIILHVVLPNTPAASQPRSSKHVSLETTDSTDSVNSKSKWTGKSTSTIYDKLRADFHSSSKAPFERVAQVRLTDPAVPTSALSPAEIEEQWVDFIEKLKVAILQSFDARVSQYEEDIREREAQQNLPGWNFCTFFILKEGLARGFENVGLLEDALSVYEELDAGLDVIIQAQSDRDASDMTGALLPFSKDLKVLIRSALDGDSIPKTIVDGAHTVPDLQDWIELESAQYPLKIERRDYQQMILTNEVSALDFRIYVFIRQIQLLLRRARVLPNAKQSNRQNELKYDAQLLSEICQRSVNFINFAARNLRRDLYAAWGGQEGLNPTELASQASIIQNIVASWKWSATLQVLSDCQIIRMVTNESSDKMVDKHDQDFGNTTTGNATTFTRHKEDFLIPDFIAGKLENWAFWGTELFSMMCGVLEETDLIPTSLSKCGVENNGESTTDDVESDAEESRAGLVSPSLQQLQRTGKLALGAYKLLTICACRCSIAAGRLRTTRHLLLALAQIEDRNNDINAMTDWLDRAPELLDHDARTPIEQKMLELYSKCLKFQNRSQDLAKCILLQLRSLRHLPTDVGLARRLFEELIQLADQLESTEMAFDGIFSVEDISKSITHTSAKDGFGVSLSLRLLFPAMVRFQAELRLRLKSTGSSAPEHISLNYNGEIHFDHQKQILTLQSNVITTGWYDLENVELQVGGLRFRQVLKLSKTDNSDDVLNPLTPYSATRIYIYPRHDAPEVQARHNPSIDLSKRRTIFVQISARNSDLKSCMLRLKPATAGFRLEMNATSTIEGKADIVRSGDYAAISINEIQIGSSSIIEIPFSVDNASLLSVSLRTELLYQTEFGQFELYDDLMVSIMLPISVKVQDIFQSASIFSRFTISSASSVPISLRDISVEGSEGCDVSTHGSLPQPLQISSKEATNWIVQILPRESAQQTSVGRKVQLNLRYQCLDEIISHSLRMCLQNDLYASSYDSVSRLLQSHLEKKLPMLWSEYDFEITGLLGEINNWSFEDLDWRSVLQTFGKDDRIRAETWLRQWHDNHNQVELRSFDAPERELILSVDVPNPQLMITTNVKINDSAKGLISAGQPVLAELRIVTDGAINDEVEITFEVVGHPDTWLVGGRRRATFDCQSGRGDVQSTIILIAQRTGHLLLPSVEVRCRRKSQSGLSNMAEVQYEVENLNLAESVQVIPSLSLSTIGIGETDSSEGYWIAETQRFSRTQSIR